MKRLFAFLVMGLALAATPVLGATQSAGKAPAKKSLVQSGRFHQIHAKKLAMDCATCHKSEQTDVLLQVPRAKVVDRQICLDCHKKGSKPAWYGVVAR